MILLDNVTIRSGEFAVSGIRLEVPDRQYGVLMGKTGCGKTSLLEAICGLRPIAAGRIMLAGRDISRLAVASRGIGYVPQDRAMFSTMSVREHLAFALKIRKAARKVIENRVSELAQLLGIVPLLDRGVQNLSGGEMQRVALGRALSHKPGVLLLDEPLSALEDETRAQMIDLLHSIQATTGVTVLHVTHSASEADHLAQRLFVLQNGHVESRPTSRALATAPQETPA
jgi:ABC-type sugar transport system ATPase subunit